MKLLSKERDGAKVAKKYDRAQTPYQRVLASGVLTDATRQRLEGIYPALDPVKLRLQLETLQKGFWRHAQEATAEAPESTGRMPERGSAGDLDATGGMPGGDPTGDAKSKSVHLSEGAASMVSGRQEQFDRRYRRSGKPRVPHTWRTRNDPFEEVWAEVEQWLDDEPERTAKSLLLELQERYAGRYSEGQLRTLQRRVQEWRRETLIRFNMEWIGEEWAGEGMTASELDEIAAGPADTPEERRPLAEEPAMLMTVG